MNSEKQFEAIYRENAVLVYRYLLSIGCPPQDIEDIIQDTFVRALVKINSFRGECKISVWLCQIAKNTWYSYLKKQKRELPHVQEEYQARECDYLEWLDLVYQLTEPYKTVFLKKVFGDWSYAELAEKYGKTESWARVTFHRARLQIHKMLNEKEDYYGK